MSSLFQQISPEQHNFLIAMKDSGLRRNIPNISWNTAEYLFELFRGRPVKNVLEIGPANGFSTLILGIACPDAEIHSIECSRHAFEELRENINTYRLIGDSNTMHQRKSSNKSKILKSKNSSLDDSAHNLEISESRNFGNEPNGSTKALKHESTLLLPAEFGPKVTSNITQQIIGNHHLYYADARELLPAFIEGSREVRCDNPRSVLVDIPKLRFDAVFIDGAFRMTKEFFMLSVPLLNTSKGAPLGRGVAQSAGGFSKGRVNYGFPVVVIDDAIKYAWKMDGFYEYLEEQNIQYELVQTDEDDGVMII